LIQTDAALIHGNYIRVVTRSSIRAGSDRVNTAIIHPPEGICSAIAIKYRQLISAWRLIAMAGAT